MECYFCKGLMVKGTAPFNVDRKGYHLHWDALPAWVCTQCGQPYFEDETVGQIEDALDILDKQSVGLMAHHEG